MTLIVPARLLVEFTTVLRDHTPANDSHVAPHGEIVKARESERRLRTEQRT